MIVQQHYVTEISFTSTARHADPYNEVDLDVVFTGPGGARWTVPAFWAGDAVWKVRFCGDEPGAYTFETRASVPSDAGLHGQTGAVTVEPYAGANALLQHGRLRVAEGRRHFEHRDGTPFFWTGDTWWMGLSTRLAWPHEFRELAADRVEKGFNAIQIVAGPYPDMAAWDARNLNEAGYPFLPEFAGVNAAYYNHADLKISHMVQSGLMPCIVGMWGYYLPWIGVEKIKRFWRYLVARYAAYPVTWCICGEGLMPYYNSETKDQDIAEQKKGWTEVMAYVRQIDGYHNLITIHPTQNGRDQVDDPALMDFEMLQTGHGDMDSVVPTSEQVTAAVAREPRMPVINSEVNYEGILGRSWENVQRLCFYHSIFNGTAGHTYGANGIWQMNTRRQPYGPSPHGRSWGDLAWDEAAQLPGSRQIGAGGSFWSRFPWWEFEVHPEWLESSTLKPGNPYGCVAVGVPKRLRLVYIPMCWDPPGIRGLEPGCAYRAQYFNPRNGNIVEVGAVKPDADGAWEPPLPPEVHDWLLVLQV